MDVLASDEYSISDCILVMEVVDSSEEYRRTLGEYAPRVMFRASWMTDASVATGPRAVHAMHAMVTNARNEGAAPHLFSVAVLTLPFILTTDRIQ